MDHFSVLNYQGSKKNLLEFIHTYAAPYIKSDDTILDIFSGTCSVGYSYKQTHRVYANDSELYSYIISTALLGKYTDDPHNILFEIRSRYDANFRLFDKNTAAQMEAEQELLKDESNASDLIDLYYNFPTIWNHKSLLANTQHSNYELFTTYYSNSYFGILQSMQIDSIRFAIEMYSSSKLYFPLMTSLFFAMKECVFSKDGHMAQPLAFHTNIQKLYRQRNKSVYEIFSQKFLSFFSGDFVNSANDNKTFNLNFEDLIQHDEIIKNVGFIYADPPYTDMQYSRYYHLLNVAARYNYPSPTESFGRYTKGLYTAERFQSKLSSKTTCLQAFHSLITFASTYKKSLAISFAYPRDPMAQKTDRYVMSIEDIKASCCREFGIRNVEIATLDYLHSNNRNSTPKKVVEYLVLCQKR